MPVRDQTPGTLTFLFTDIERSSRSWQESETEMLAALERHDSIISEAVASHGGRIFKHTGDGVVAVFASAIEAVLAAVDGQRALSDQPLLVRMALHTGEAFERDGDYFGPALNRCSRLEAAAHGGQVLLSSATEIIVRGRLPAVVRVKDLGEYVLRDVGTERIHQVVAPGLTATFAPPRAAGASRGRVPVSRSPLVGREDELAELAGLLERNRLLTLTGIGGAGKTRLALELATRTAERHPDGVYVADLAAVADPAVLPTTLALALELRLGGGIATAQVDVTQEILDHLSTRTALLVLDNCEHLLDPIAGVVDLVLDRCPTVTLLATSREALQVEGEASWRVPSLGLPASVELFVARATAANPQFALSPDNEGAVADICRRLDGIPLAIEFAAAQVPHMTPAQIATRLDDRFRLLVGGRRRSQRQQTLQAVLDWSHDLLDEPERSVLRRLSVFAGAFSLEAAEAVCEGATERPVSHVVGLLVAKSLVVAEQGAGAVSYRLLETVRLYAEEKLHQAGESPAARDAHRDWYLGSLQRMPWDHVFLGFTTGASLERDIDNLRVALEWSAGSGRRDLVAEMTARLNSLWWINARTDEASRWLEAAGGATEMSEATSVACRVVRGFVEMITGDYLGAMATWDAAAAAGGDGEPALIARLMRCVIGLLADPDVEARLQEVERRALAAGMPSVVRGARDQLGHVWMAQGRVREAADLFSDVVAHADPAETFFFDLAARHDLAVAFHLLGEHDRSIEESLRLLALRTTLEMDATGASDLELFGSSMAHLALGLAHAGRGEGAEARRRVGEVVTLTRRRRLPIIRRDLVLVLVALALAEGDPARGARLLAVARGEGRFAMFRTPASYAVYRHYRDILRGLLPPEEVARARHDAKGITVDDAIDDDLAIAGGDN